LLYPILLAGKKLCTRGEQREKRAIKESGGKVITCTEEFTYVERAIRNRFITVYLAEITVMATDTVLIPIDKDIADIRKRAVAQTPYWLFRQQTQQESLT